MNDIITHAWYSWTNLFGGLGLPWDKNTTAYVALVLVFYGLGKAFKTLTEKGK